MAAECDIQKDIDRAFESAMASPFSKVGRRLHAETELAGLFNVGRWHRQRRF